MPICADVNTLKIYYYSKSTTRNKCKELRKIEWKRKKGGYNKLAFTHKEEKF